ncbi:acyl-CoA N-acyltransferase, partial [Dunaliella salina]
DFLDQQEGTPSQSESSQQHSDPSPGNESPPHSPASSEPEQPVPSSKAALDNQVPTESSPREGQASEGDASALQGRESVLQSDNEHISAISTTHFLQSIDCRPDAQVLGIRLLGVDFEYRRQGIGSQLLEYVKEVAQLAGARMAWLNVAEFNPNALSFYEAAGFKRTTRFKEGAKGNFPLYVLPLEPAKKKGGQKQVGGRLYNLGILPNANGG